MKQYSIAVSLDEAKAFEKETSITPQAMYDYRTNSIVRLSILVNNVPFFIFHLTTDEEYVVMLLMKYNSIRYRPGTHGSLHRYILPE